MTATHDDAVADLQRAHAELQQRLDEYRAQRDAALAREAALAEVLDVINRNPGDPLPVFQAILEKAHTLCGATVGALATYDGEYFRRVATHGFPDVFALSLHAPHRGGVGSLALIRGERLFHTPDLRAIEVSPSDVVTRGFVEDTTLRTFLMVPLRKDGSLLGSISAFRYEVRPFSERAIALLESFAAQAVIAMENARLLTEQREALEQQTATAKVLAIINASPGNLEPVFEAILDKAHGLCGATAGSLLIYDGSDIRALSAHGFSEAVAAFLRQPNRPAFVHRALLDGARLIHIPDLKVLKPPPGDEMARMLIEESDTRTMLVVPLRKDGAVLGFITGYRLEVRPFSKKEIALVENFAAQAVIAMENARLLGELRKRTGDLQELLEYQTATSDVLKVISRSGFNLDPVFQAAVDTATRLCRADQAVIYRHQDGAYRWAAGTSMLPEYERLEREAIIHPGTGTLVGRVAMQGRTVQVLDAWTDPLYEVKNDARVGGVHTMLGVPLLRDGALIGVFGLARRRVEPFTERQVELVSTFADQAVIAIENARLFDDLRQRTSDLQESLEYQTATSDVLKVISRSAFDLNTVLQTVVASAVNLCRAERASLYRYRDGRCHFEIGHNNLREYEELERNAPIAAGPETLVGRTMQEQRAVQIVDALHDPYYGPKDQAQIGDVRSMLGVPLLRDGELIGVFGLARSMAEPFTDRQVELVTTFADQAVIAIENARLITEQREALEQQTATAEVLQVINASPGNLTPVFDAVLEKAMRLCGAAFGGLHTYDGHRLLTVATRGVPAVFADYRAQNQPMGASGGRAARILETKRSLHILDLMTDSSYLAGDASDRAAVDLGGARTVLLVPLLKEAAVLGIIAIYRQEVRAFSDKQITLLENFAAQAVIAMENARLLHQLRARTDELAQRQAELRATFENMADGVAMFDETPRLVAWNRKFQEILDVPDGDLAERRTFAEYIRYLTERGEFGEAADPEAQLRRLRENAGRHYSYERTRPDGRVIEVRHNPVPSGGFVMIYADITERKRNEAAISAARDAAEAASRTIDAAYRELKAAQANLIQAEKMASLGQLTAGIAHEIKNPLNFVNNFAILSVELLAELKETAAPALEALDDDRRADIDEVVGMLTSNLEKITEHGRRADGIVRSMLEHSRGGSGERRSVDLNTLVEEALNLAYHGARAQDQSFNITLQRDFGEAIAPIELVPQDVTRVFLNLFSNGFYAANKRARNEAAPGFAATLKVTTRDRGDAVEIRVRDNGIGIPGEIKEKLFQPFFTTKPTGDGTGLGLSISYDIVTQQHGGTITVDSLVGEYTEFTIRLPRDR